VSYASVCGGLARLIAGPAAAEQKNQTIKSKGESKEPSRPGPALTQGNPPLADYCWFRYTSHHIFSFLKFRPSAFGGFCRRNTLFLQVCRRTFDLSGINLIFYNSFIIAANPPPVNAKKHVARLAIAAMKAICHNGRRTVQYRC
jgi:hypothetical protein